MCTEEEGTQVMVLSFQQPAGGTGDGEIKLFVIKGFLFKEMLT
jgi:hypothetical protein